MKAVQNEIDDQSLKPAQIRQALRRIMGATWGESGEERKERREDRGRAEPRSTRRSYGEEHHIGGKPREVVELYRALDRLCQDFAPGEVVRRYLAKYVSWSLGKATFCCCHLQRSGMRVWLKLAPDEVPGWASFARDVSQVGHWGVGDVELAIDSLQTLRAAEPLIRGSFETVSRE